jgi:hypothetical protein
VNQDRHVRRLYKRETVSWNGENERVRVGKGAMKNATAVWALIRAGF